MDIYEGWKNLTFPDPKIEEIATKKAKICSECPHNKNNICSLCGCFLSAKTRSPLSKCPDNRWLEIENSKSK